MDRKDSEKFSDNDQKIIEDSKVKRFLSVYGERPAMFINNENGALTIIASLMILVLLTILGTMALRTSITELQGATNALIYQKNFYVAESGIALAPEWVKLNLAESDFNNVDYIGEFDMQLDGANHFYAQVEHQKDIDPADGHEKVLLYGDENGDYLNEINFTTGVPLEIVTSNGTHIRGGNCKIRATFIFEPIFMMPDAALLVHSSVNGNGVSGQIIGEGPPGTDCEPVADIKFEVLGGPIEYGGSLGDTPKIEQSSGMYPFPLIKELIEKYATQKIPGSNNVDNIETSEESPGVVLLTGNSKVTNLTGYGILFIDGDFKATGNLDWHGLILVGGNVVFSGGGSKMIYGAVIVLYEAQAINGSVDIIYDCDVLNNLFDNFSNYRMTSWSQIFS
jgi:hypothetical protein